MTFILDWCNVLMQMLLPRYWLTALVYRAARIRQKHVKDFLVRQFVRIFRVDTDEVLLPVPDAFPTFNDFFIRELVDGARPIDLGADTIVSPADGTISAAGRIDGDRIFQAKGMTYTLADLLATDIDDAARYVGGSFATIYLAPYNYHRVHSPLAGELRAAHYVPGDLYSVNARTARRIPGLFTRNERVVLHCNADQGPFAVILVGALNVGSISTVWTGELRPRKKGVVEDLRLRGAAPAAFDKGATLGWFNMGSTVILLLPPEGAGHFSTLADGGIVRVGQAIGRLPGH